MAFPVVASTNVTSGTSSASPGVTINMPSGITAGDLLIAFCAGDTDTTFTASGWTSITAQANGTASQLTVFAKLAAGSDTMTLVGEANDYAVITARITGHAVTTIASDILKGTAATGADAAPNPPSVTISSTKDWLFLACFGADDDDIPNPDTGFTGWPASYSAGVARRSATGTSTCCVAFAQRQLNTGSNQDPGTFTMDASEEWIAQTFAIPPQTAFTLPAVTGEYLVTGEAAVLKRGYRVQVNAGAYAVTGGAARLIKHRTISTETVLFDGSVSITDAGSAWTNDANAFDGSTSTFATCTTSGSHILRGKGHTRTTATNQIINIWYRVYATTTSGSLTVGVLNSSAASWILYNVNPFSGEGWNVTDAELRTAYNIIRDWPYALSSTEIDGYQAAFWSDSGTVNVGVARAEMVIDSIPNTVATVYNLTDTAFTDAQDVWSQEWDINNDYNSQATLAGNTSGGSSTNNCLKYTGTAAPSSGDTIIDVYARLGVGGGGSYEMHCEVWTSGKTEQLVHVIAPAGSVSWLSGPWVLVQPPAAGWTWSALQTLEFYYYGVGTNPGNIGKAAIGQIKVFTPVAAAYTRQVDTGSYLVTGQAALFKRSLQLEAEVGSYAVSGQPVTFSKTLLLFDVVTGTYSLTGVDALFKRALQLEAEVGSYAVSGQPAALSISGGVWTADADHFTVDSATHLADGYHTDGAPASTLYVEVGIYAVTGAAVSFKVSRLPTVTGTYALTGQAAAFKRGYKLPTVTGAYDVTGVAADPNAARKLRTDFAIYFVAGADVVLQTAGTLGAVTGSYAVTGEAALFKRSLILGAVTGSYAVTGEAAALQTVGTLGAVTGTYEITGASVAFSRQLILPVVTGSYAVAGEDAALTSAAARTLLAAEGGYSVTGIDAEFRRGYYLGAGATSDIGYVDASVAGPFDTNNHWANDANAFDGSLSTYANTIDTAALEYLEAYGTSFTSHPSTFVDKIEVRAYAHAVGGSSELWINFQTIQVDGTITYNADTPGWSDWLTLSRHPSQGPYTSTDVDNLNVFAFRPNVGGGNGELRLYKIEVRATYTIYRVSGEAVTLTKTYTLPAATGSYEVYGFEAAIITEGAFQAEEGTYVVEGFFADFTRQLRIPAVAGTYSVAGQPAALRYNHCLETETGSYALSGESIALLQQRVLATLEGPYTVTGLPAQLSVPGRLSAVTGQYLVTGASVQFAYSGFSRRVFIVS